jgi:MFS family permease
LRSTWLPVAGITGWQTTASICFYAVFAGTSLFQDAYDLSSTATGLLLTALMVGYTLSLLPLGALIDAYGEKPSMVFGLAGLGTAALALALVDSLAAFVAAVFLLGVCYGTAIPSTNRAVVNAVPAPRTNLAMGIKQVGVTGGSAISAAVVTGLAAAYAWNSGFLAVGVLALLVAAGFGLWYGASEGTGSVELPRPWALPASAEYLLLLVAGCFLGAAMFTTTGYVVEFGREGVDAPIAVAGLLLSGVQVAGSVSRVVSGHLLDHAARPPGVVAPRLLTAHSLVAAAALVSLTRVDSLPAAAVTFTVLGYALLGFMGVYYSYLAVITPEEQFGEATAGAQVAVNGGAVVVPPLFGSLVDGLSFDAAWLALAACCSVAALVFFVLSRRG